MFLQKVTVMENRKKHVYIEIFDRKPDRGKKAEPIARFGPVNRLTGKLDAVVKSLTEFCEERFVSTEEISAERVRSWGPILVARHLWVETGLWRIISDACGRKVADAAFALTANRLVDPRSERGMDSWLEKVFVPLLEQGSASGAATRRKSSGGSETSPDNRWDNTVRKLAAKHRAIETALFETVKQMAGNCQEAVVYSLDTTFAERMTSRRHSMGWPARRPQRNIRLHFGTIVCGGWPLTIRFFGGSEPNAAQIKRFIEESRRRFGFQKVLFVAPSGTDEEKLHELESLGVHYLVGVRRRRDPRAVEVIQQAGRQWVKIDANTKVQEVLLPVETDLSLQAAPSQDTDTERYFLVHNRQDAQEERVLRTSVVNRALRALEGLKRAVEDGRLKKPATIMTRVERILTDRRAYRYISWRITPQGRLEFWEDERKSSVRRAYEGISLLRTSGEGISPTSAVAVYEGLRRLENAFDRIHDTAASRSTRLHLPELEENTTQPRQGVGKLFAGHLLVSQLAFLLRCRLEKRLLEKKIAMSVEDAVEPLETISLAELGIGGEKHLVVSPGNRAAGKIVRALGIESLTPTAEGKSNAETQRRREEGASTR